MRSALGFAGVVTLGVVISVAVIYLLAQVVTLLPLP